MSEATDRAEELGRQAHESDWLDRAASAGLLAYGLVHVVIGWLAVMLAFGDRQGSATSTGAVQQIAEQPFGGVVVWLIAIGMVLLVGWQLLEAALGHRDEDGAKRTGKRLLSVGKAVIYGAIGVSAVKVATGSSSQSQGTDSMTAKLMDRPGGQVLVGMVAVALVVVGCAFLYQAQQEKFLKHLDGEGRSGQSGTAYKWLGKAGYAAKGVAMLVVSSLFGYAAISHEAKKSGGLDQALREILDQPFGPVLLCLVGVGFAAFGLFCFARARYLDR